MKYHHCPKNGRFLFLFSMAFSILFIIYTSFLQPGIVIDEVEKESGPTGSGSSLAKKDSNFDIGSVEKPWLTSEALVNHGAKVYRTNCAVCHGDKGLGDGPASQGINPKNLVKGQWKQGGTSKALFVTLTKGVPNTSMVSFKQLSPPDRWALVHFIRNITKDKPKDNLKELEDFAKTAK